ncbi:acyl-CoA thioesterase [Christensenella timonensis]|uniref:acyl-CoA thioesterase n=1 Tax=Christensenella timonensis TaxID=1816678 RepID=UPI000836290C|nr:acyl-CoA thioesterase [Christensenella timonensis]
MEYSGKGYAETTHIVMSGDINQLGNLHGGTLMQWVDIIGAVAATRHCRSIVTTAVLDSMDFKHPVPLGGIVTLQACVTWTGRTSLEVRVDVYSEKCNTDEKTRTNTAYLVFVALGYDGKPREVPPFVPNTENERREYGRAQKRREERLRKKAANEA